MPLYDPNITDTWYYAEINLTLAFIMFNFENLRQMIMKRKTLLICMLLSISVIYFCEKDDKSTYHEDFQELLNMIYLAIGDSLKTYDINDSVHFRGIASQSYIDICGSEANLDLFHLYHEDCDSILAVPNTIEEDKLENKVDSILALSASEGEAIVRFEQILGTNSLTDNERTAFIAIKETIIFMSVHNEILHANYEGKSGKSTKGWWSSWGKCTAGIIGGGIIGGLAGCGVTAIACPVGAVLGTIGGALAGSASAC